MIAVASSEVQQWGCPYCGYRSGSSMISGGGAAVIVCGECRDTYIALADGIIESPISAGDSTPTLEPHPRRGTPSLGRPDKQPEGGGEFFHSRGIGKDWCQCFVCGANENGHNVVDNIAAFVQCKEAGERVVAMFEGRARLDFRKHEPDYVQVKIGVCTKHKRNLRRLDELVADGILTSEMIIKVTPKARK